MTTTPDQIDSLLRIIGQINNLVQGVATTAGQVMSLATVSSHHVWLGLTVLHGRDREELFRVDLFSQLFRFRRLEEEKAQLCCHLPLAQSRGGKARCCNATLRWRTRRQA